MARRKKVIKKSLRQEVVRRDNCRCRACGLPDVDNLQADHIVPETKGGTDTLDNLQALCGICNNRKGTTDVGELAILPPLDNTITVCELFDDIAVRREAFNILLKETRANEIDNTLQQVNRWRMQGVKGWVIRKRIEKDNNKSYADKIMRMALNS
tara:strand:- start:182 stop:646 length:465 start_codon:yes stop_codon:yes gene_type:complete